MKFFSFVKRPRPRPKSQLWLKVEELEAKIDDLIGQVSGLAGTKQHMSANHTVSQHRTVDTSTQDDAPPAEPSRPDMEPFTPFEPFDNAEEVPS